MNPGNENKNENEYQVETLSIDSQEGTGDSNVETSSIDNQQGKGECGVETLSIGKENDGDFEVERLSIDKQQGKGDCQVKMLSIDDNETDSQSHVQSWNIDSNHTLVPSQDAQRDDIPSPIGNNYLNLLCSDESECENSPVHPVRLALLDTAKLPVSSEDTCEWDLSYQQTRQYGCTCRVSSANS